MKLMVPVAATAFLLSPRYLRSLKALAKISILANIT